MEADKSTNDCLPWLNKLLDHHSHCVGEIRL